MSKIEDIKQAIELLENQRAILGTALVEAALAPLKEQLAALEKETISEQRKLVTVLFSDLVNYTTLAEEMDPEDVREILHIYFSRCEACIEQYGGVVEKYIGDAVMAVFGLRLSREKDSEHAILAAIAMQTALGEMNEKFEQEYGVRLAMRVGIHTGHVVVSMLGERKGQDFVVVGDPVNIASRLQSLAPPDGIVISQDTFRLVRGAFDFSDLGLVTIKGRKDSLQAYLILRKKSMALPLDKAASIPIVGREAEILHLEGILSQVLEQGSKHNLLIIGDAGTGKSRLVEEFENKLELRPERFRYFKGRAASYFQNQPYSLMRNMFSFRFDIQESDSDKVARAKFVEGIGDELWADFIGQMLGFNFGDSPYIEGVKDNPQQLRDQALVYLSRYCELIAEASPLVIIVEDIQWADRSSLWLLSALQRELAEMRLLFIGTARPEYLERQEASSQGGVFQSLLHLRPLSEAQSLDLARRQLGNPEKLPDTLRNLVINSAGGNPFFIQELIRMLLDEGGITEQDGEWQVHPERLAAVRVPPSLTEFLQARFDRLPPKQRALLQRASVIGRIFWDQAIEFLNSKDGTSGSEQILLPTKEMLEQLRSQEIILLKDSSSFEGTNEYLFEHNLFREVTYDSLLKRQRRFYHAHAADWLEKVTENCHRKDDYAAFIAEHYALAEENEPAARWFTRVGHLAAERFANDEAIYGYSRALDLLAEVEVEKRFEVLLARERVYDRQGDRQAQLRDIEALEELIPHLSQAQQVEVLLRRAGYAFIISDFHLAIEPAQKAIRLAQSCEDKRLVTEAYLSLGKTLAFQNEHNQAIPYLEKALEHARKNELRTLEAEGIWNMGIIATNTSKYDLALELLDQAAQLYRQLKKRDGEAVAVAQKGIVYLFQGKYDPAKEFLEAGLELFRSMGHRLREAIILQSLGAMAYELGHYERAQEVHVEALRIYEEVGDGIGKVGQYINLGNVAQEAGRYELAQEHYNTALQLVRTLGDRLLEGQVLSNMGLLHMFMENLPAALEACMQAVEILSVMEMPFYDALASSNYAQVLEMAGRLDEADQYYRKALEKQKELGLENNIMESRAGLASVAITKGNLPDALSLVEQVLPTLMKKELQGVERPFRIFWVCYQVLTAHRDARAIDVLHEAQEMLQARAAEFTDADLRCSYLENVRLHHDLLSAQAVITAG